ncbi:hypothetical protein [Roseibium sp. RKSG952]|uniref:hypothetical protein n=1 Tax=Roseibium sp. RKSG952 TaxID=2529384 RepID=UPI0012BBF1DB|nr:hypothetical protein [Roseibium sp. RKSG952]MTI00148.1 hypothetical protein [Roseibium sp. RKSG952]
MTFHSDNASSRFLAFVQAPRRFALGILVNVFLLFSGLNSAEARSGDANSYFDCQHFMSFMDGINGTEWDWRETQIAINTFNDIDRSDIEHLYLSCYAVLLDVISRQSLQDKFHVLKQQMALVSVTEGDLLLIKNIPDDIVHDRKLYQLLSGYIRYVTDRLTVILLNGDIVRKNTIAYNCLQDLGITDVCVHILKKDYARFRSSRVERDIKKLMNPGYTRRDPFISPYPQ